MENQTFRNLSTGRQEIILAVAFEEFALKGYQNASLSTIVKKIGIAKGSFYRYFSSKKDLFCYLLDIAAWKRYQNLDRILEREDIGFFDLIKLNFKAIISSDKENPLISGFMYQVMHERDNSEVSDVIDKLYAGVIEKTKNIIEVKRFKEELTIRDSDLLAFHIFYSQLMFYDYIAIKYKMNYGENIRRHLPVLNLPDEELEKIIDLSVEILQYGLTTKTR